MNKKLTLYVFNCNMTIFTSKIITMLNYLLNMFSTMTTNSNSRLYKKTPVEFYVLNSPYSLLVSLSPLLLGVTNETIDELAHALNISSSQIVNFVKSIQDDQQKIKLYGSVDILNIMLSREDIILRSQYLKSISNLTNHKYFETVNCESIVPYINNLVKQSTNGTINTILKDDDIDKNTFFVLLNTMYFHSNWSEQFNEYDTHSNTFNSIKYGIREEQFMISLEKSFQYYETSSYQIALLPYENKDVAFCIVLPKNKYEDPIGHNILQQKSDFVSSVIKGEYICLNLSLPKFKREIELDLIPLLKGLGVTKLFDYTMQAINMVDYVPDRIGMSIIKQKIKIEVNETGTTASSATSSICRLEGCFYSEPVKTIEFNCNHSFTYYIVHIPTQNILVSGIFE